MGPLTLLSSILWLNLGTLCRSEGLQVVENSGVCETTGGVYQASGYADIGSNRNIFFWFFAARQNPESAPISLWFQGGPGVSSLVGLTQEHGPCRLSNDSSKLVPNSFSWNERSNVIYIDQPVGAGFSKGDAKTNSSAAAAKVIWKFLQVLFEDKRFQKYLEKPLAIWTESFGGHFGASFGRHFLDQNQAIDAGTVQGKKINLKVLGIGNGLIDPLLQYPGYLAYAGGNNSYHPDGMVDKATLKKAEQAWSGDDGCQARIEKCYKNGKNDECQDAQSYCNKNVLKALYGPWNPYFVPNTDPDSYPPKGASFLNSPSFKSQIGASGSYVARSNAVEDNFKSTGDWMRNYRPDLEYVIKSGVRTLIFDGDADFVFNYIGEEAMVDGLQTQFSGDYKSAPWVDYTVRGQAAGKYKSAGNGALAYLRVYGAGHKVAAYAHGNLGYGEAALQMFNQVVLGDGLQST